MFDWDRDFDDITGARHLAPAPAPVPLRARMRGVALRWAGIGALAWGLGVLGMLSIDMTGGAPGSVASLVRGLGGVPPAQAADLPPSELVAYELDQYRNMQRGLARFSDAELMDYALVTAHALGDRTDTMTPFLLDVLFLTERELQRRGLDRPVTVSHAATLRAALRERARDI